MTSREKLAGLVLIVVGATLVVCGGGGGGGGGPSGPSGPRNITVTTGATPPPRFIPNVATVDVGGTVTWTNGSPAPHNVVSSTNAWPRSPDLNPGQTFAVTFNQAGSFDYECTLHEGMTGVIVVQ